MRSINRFRSTNTAWRKSLQFLRSLSQELKGLGNCDNLIPKMIAHSVADCSTYDRFARTSAASKSTGYRRIDPDLMEDGRRTVAVFRLPSFVVRPRARIDTAATRTKAALPLD